MTRQLSLSLTSSQQDTPASPSHQRGSEKGLMTPDISGLTSDELFRHEGPLGVFSRMFLDTSLWGSTRCSLRWKMMDTKQKRSLYRLLPSMHNTGETGSGLWPTPRACSAMSAPNIQNRVNDKHPNLEREVARSLWPTPTASDNRDRGHLGNPSIQRRQAIGKQLNLSMVVSDKSGRLNPEWVEWLMGYPINHTALKPLETPLSPK